MTNLETNALLDEIIISENHHLLLADSIGINVLGNSDKACSFDCPYCFLGPSHLKMNQIKSNFNWTSPEDIQKSIDRAFQKALALNDYPKYIEVSGNGEPTIHPQIGEIIDLVTVTKNSYTSDTQICLLTNGAHLDNKKTISSIKKCDQIIVKLDAGNDEVFIRANNPLVRLNVSRIISSCKLYENIAIQSLFFDGCVSNASNAEIDEWIEVVGMINPKKVYITTLISGSTTEKVKPVSEDTLYTILSKLKRRTSIDAEVLFHNS